MKSFKVNIPSILVLYFIICNMFLKAQNGTITFHIKDNIKNSYVSASITITGNNFRSEVKAKNNGSYIFTSKTGKYHFLFTANGYKNLETDFVIEKDSKLNVDVSLDELDGTKFILQDELKDRSSFQGFMYDSITGQPLKNATVYLLINNTKTTTNAKGFYKLESLIFSTPKSSADKILSTDIVVKKKGYGTLTFKNVKLFAGRCMINGFLVKKGKPKTITYLHGMEMRDTKNYSGYNNSTIETITESITEIDYKKKTIAPINSTNNYYNVLGCSPGASIKVGTSCSCNSCSGVSVMSLESYVQKGLDDEWIPSWGAECLKAGAVAYRTFGAYFINHPINANYDISSTTCKQVWNGTTLYTSCTNAANNTLGEVIVIGSGGSTIALIEYSAENNNQGCGDGFAGTGTSPCISDAVCVGKTPSGHGRGMCAWGSHRWDSQQSKLYTWILDHYYNPSNQYRCNSVPTCSPATGNNFCIGPPAPQVLNVSTVCNYSIGNTCQATESMAPLTINGVTATNALDVWYSFVATGPTTSITVQGGTGFDPIVQLLDNACGNNLVAADASGSGAIETMTYNTTTGTTYYVRVYDFHKNTYATDFQICVISQNCTTPCVGVKELTNDLLLTIYPNPTNDILSIKGSDIYSEKITVTLTNVLGEILYKECIKIDNHFLDTQINMKDLASSVYFLSIKTEGKEQTTKIIKQ